ncbi:TonB-dependent receptor plug domain-containing protein [Agaribacter marinus]|uniref:Outer membrane protein n=1 Tax=Agaribacter marinus TaxID=1431249 RepID=A0AA37T239_9ALTE|nr:TonB-dependent receptor [Agaribacter marinus]GLR72206.1 outer membrane protein [Agaribacter marinus]
MKQTIRKIALTAAAVSLALGHSNLMAQESNNDDSVERIAVTGSLIKRIDMEGPSPLTSIDAAQIENTGVTDLIGLFAKLPISGQGTFSTQGNSSDDTANGGSSVSLRGLGADSTLILINGRRVSVSPFAKGIDTAFVDINNIPISAIKRVDILKDGASATYGSDAIAGVINIVLKDDFEGAEVSARVGTTADGGGQEQNFSLVFGSNSDKVKHTFILDYFDREEVLYADRSYSRSANQAALRPNIAGAEDFRSSSGIPGTIALRSDPTNRIIDEFGADRCAPEDIDRGANLCRYDYAPHMTMIPDAERFSFNYLGRYEISDSLRGYIDFNGQNSKSLVRGAGSPSFNELFMDGDNVNHPFADMPDHPFFMQDLTMRRRTVDIGNREKRVDTDYFRTVMGLSGEIQDWSWDAAYSYIKSESVERGVDGFPNSRRAQEAIDSGLWNPFEPSTNTQEALDFIETVTTRVGKSTSKTLDFTLSGAIAEMSAGDLMLALKAEYREEAIADNPDDQFLRGDVFGTEATQANGDRDSKSVSAELAIPLLDTLEVQLAVRYEDYSDFGTTTDPKVSFLYSPLDNLSFRGSYGTAFRAPSLHQLGLGRTDESPNLVDTLRCAAVDLGCSPAEYTAIFAGNPDLGPEESSSYNLGVIYEINENLDFSLDYYSYDIENIIDSDTQFVISNFGTDPSVVERIPTGIANDPGEVVRVFDSFQNIGDLDTSGLDFDIGYRLPSDVGDFKFRFAMNYVLKYEELRPDANGGQRLSLQEGQFEQPEVRHTTSVDWSQDDISATLAINYIGEFDGDADSGFGDKTVDSMTTVDLVANYRGIDNTTLSLGVTNLLNEEPPFSHHDFFGYVNTVHSGQGRFTYVKASYKF